MSRPWPASDTKRIVVAIDSDLEDIVPGFLENRHKDVLALQTALTRADWQTVRLLGHRMKGDGGGYGFELISDIGQALEQAAIGCNESATKQEVARLIDFLTRLEVVYRK